MEGGEQLTTGLGGVTLRNVTPNLIAEILQLVQSGAPRTILDLMWSIILNPQAIRTAIVAGGAAKGVPAWLKILKYKHTWESQYAVDGNFLNCAAFCLGNWLNDGGRHSTETVLKYHPAVRRAKEQVAAIQARFGWGAEVSIADLEVFKTAWPKYRLTLISPNKTCPEASLTKVWEGAEYVQGSDHCDCVMIHHQNHWALVYSLQSFIKQFKNGGAFKYCYECERIIKFNSGTVDEWPCHREGVTERVIPLERICKRPICRGRVHSKEDPCPYKTCLVCNGDKKYGDVHRCLVKPKHISTENPHDKYWNERTQDYNFCTDFDGDGSVPAFFAYDIETMVVEDDVEPDVDELLPAPELDDTYGVDLDDYTALQRAYIADLASRTEDLSEYNLTGKVRRFEPNLVVVTNIYSGKLPKNVGDDWYQPSLQSFRGPNCMVDLVNYLRSYNRGHCYAFAHNGSGFDGKFIFEAVTKIDGLAQSPILRGTNFLSLTVKRDFSGKKTRFYDSMLHLPGSLDNLLKGWFANSPQPNLAGGKGYFPHKFNTLENQGYKGLIPHLDYFGPDNMSLGKGSAKFKAPNALRDWHAEQTGEWDFDKEILKYCNMDVIGLAALLNMYMSISIPKGGIPLLKTTAPSFVHELYLQRTVEDLVVPELNLNKLRAHIKNQDPGLAEAEVKRLAYELRADNNQAHVNELMERAKVGWPVLKSPEYNFVRRSLRGGRTVTSDSFMELTDEEMAQGIRIIYQDVTSLYPAEQMMRKFPMGIPKIHFYTWGFRPCWNCQDLKDDSGEFILECECPETRQYLNEPRKGYMGTTLDMVDCRGTQPTAEQFINDDEMFGYVCCDLTPPTNLYHPVIQIKKDIMKDGRKIGEKCQNNLLVEDHKKLYLDTPTLKKCLESGYTLDFCYRFDKYLKGDPLWKEGAMEFYIDKERTSGKKPSATEKGEWCRDYLAQTGLEADNDLEAYVKLYNNQVDPLGTLLEESMDTLEWADRPAQRQCFKIFNNCGWGKHAQRPVMPRTKMLHVIDDYPEIATIFENLTKNLLELKGCLVYSKGERLMFSTLDKNTSPDHHNSYIPAGAMVPAYGRLTLLEGLEICGDRVAMCDTDSIVYKTSLDPTKNIPISSVLGKFSEEKVSKKIIREFVGFGPKCYSLLTEEMVDVEQPDRTIIQERYTETKLKGVRQTVKVQNIDHAFMKNQVLHYLETGEIPATYVPQWGMKTDLGKLSVGPHDFAKKIKMSDEDEIKGFRKILANGSMSSKIYPYGYTL